MSLDVTKFDVIYSNRRRLDISEILFNHCFFPKALMQFAWVFFVGLERYWGMDNDRQKSVYCPRCGMRVCGVNNRSTIDFLVKCKNCKTGIKYRFDTDSTLIVKLPERQTSSGCRFY